MKTHKILTGLLMLATALTGTSCNDDDDDQVLVKAPTITVGNPALSEDNTKAVVEIKPSAETATWYWKCEKQGTTDGTYTTVEGNEPQNIEIPIELDQAYTLSVYAENKGGRDAISRGFIFRADDIMDDLVEFEVKNISPYSMDVFVKKSAKCSKYVIGAIINGTPEHEGDSDGVNGSESGEIIYYTEKGFVEEANRSINPETKETVLPYNWSDKKNDSFNENTLAKKTTQEYNTSKGLVIQPGCPYIIAIYALDAEGNYKVYTQEIKTPTPEVNSDVEVKVALRAGEGWTTLTTYSFDAEFSADEKRCVKMLTGFFPITGPDAFNEFNELTDDNAKKANILKQALSTFPAQPYTGKFSNTYKNGVQYLRPSESYVVYGIAIDTEGKINVGFTTVTMKTPEATGKGVFTNNDKITYEQPLPGKVYIKGITVNSETSHIRLLAIGTNVTEADMLSVFMDPSNDIANNGPCWRKYFPGDDMKVIELTFPASFYGETMVKLYGVTVDKDGNMSEPVIVGTIDKLKTLEDFETGGGEDPESQYNWTGSGKANLDIKIEYITDENYVDYVMTITKGEGSDMVYKFMVDRSEDVEDIKTAIENDYLSEDLSYNIVQFEDGIYTQEMYSQEIGWASTLAIVTKDSSNKLKLVAYYNVDNIGKVTKVE